MQKKSLFALVTLLFLSITASPLLADFEWDTEVKAFIDNQFTSDERVWIHTFFGAESALPGPIPADQDFGGLSQEVYKETAAFRSLDGRVNKIRLTPDIILESSIQGAGTQEDPYRGLIAAALAQYTGQRLVFVIPAGYYEEEGIDIGSNWLEGESGAVLVAPAESQGARHLITVSESGGIVGLTIDASARRYDPSLGSRNLGGITVQNSYMVVIANNHLKNIPLNGISGNGTGALILGNTIENCGHSGIRFRGARWLVVNNRIVNFGYLRKGGDDGIIVGDGGEGMIVTHNLIVSGKSSDTRHGIGTHVAFRNRIENNVIILRGKLRGGINLSDGSSENRIHRNLILNVDSENGQTPNAIRTNGQQNVITANFIFGCNNGVNTRGWPASGFSTIEGNQIVVTGTPVLQGPFDTVSGNQIHIRNELR